MNPVLIIGGSGVVGAETARMLRRFQPDLPIAVGGRDHAKASRVAADLGNAAGVAVDLSQPDLGQGNAAYSAVVIFLKDETLASLRYAQERKLPYVSLSSGTFEIGPEVAAFAHRPAASPVLLASQWLAGAAVLPTLHLARRYDRLDAIRLGLLLDEEDMGGPAAYADYDRIVGAASATLVLEDGRFAWVRGDAAKGRFTAVDGTEMAADAYGPLDVPSLAAATAARRIRVDLTLGVSSSRRRGEPFSTEIVIELEGIMAGRPSAARHTLVHPRGQAPLTALGVAMGLEALLGLSGRPAKAPGLYLPELVIDGDDYLRRLAEIGAVLSFGEPAYD